MRLFIAENKGLGYLVRAKTTGSAIQLLAEHLRNDNIYFHEVGLPFEHETEEVLMILGQVTIPKKEFEL